MEDQISRFLQERIDAGDFPSAVYLVAEKGEIVLNGALGHAMVEPEKIEARLETIYDVASLTKPLVTGLLCAQLVETEKIKLDEVVGHYLPELARAEELRPELAAGDYLEALISELLTHNSGYQAWRPFYLLVPNFEADPREKVLEIIANEIPVLFEPDVIYSDLNFIMLSGVLEKVCNARLDAVFNAKIAGPLGLRDTYFNPPAEMHKRVAASEKGNEYEKNTCIEANYLKQADDAVFRSEVIWGEVHDGNAYFMGGIAGHAGLFSTAEEVFKIAQQFLPKSTTLLKPETCAMFRTNYTKGLNEARSIAFQLAETKDSTAGTKMSPESFGHLGFTGTSLWIDPVKERIFILLTNRTHNHPLPFVNINSVRRRFHDLAIDILDKNS